MRGILNAFSLRGIRQIHGIFAEDAHAEVLYKYVYGHILPIHSVKRHLSTHTYVGLYHADEYLVMHEYHKA